MYVIVKNYIISQLIENEGFDEKDFLPIFVKSINTVEEIKKLMGEPKNFYYRYFQMKKQYLVSC